MVSKKPAEAPKAVPKVVRKKAKSTIRRGTLRTALLANMKAASGRKDIALPEVSRIAVSTQMAIRIEERAGYPVKRAKGSVDPKNWKSCLGVPIEVDFARAFWLPDDWGQGVKPTRPTSHSTGRAGGILTCYVAPDGKAFFHKETSEEYAGRKFDKQTGFNGQVRLAKLQAQQAVQLARAAIRDSGSKGGEQELIGTDPDAELFALLTPKERKCLPSKDEFHFCVVSARRATSLSGVSDIMMVETQLIEAGVTATWYVDEASVKDYKSLDLKVTVGGKLCESRNKCLKDARRLNKVCVQLSDDIFSWEYREGPVTTQKTDAALNAAWSSARRYIISPVAAARFICAKMRGADDPKPKLGGCYMLQSCSRTFAGPPFSRQHFILGDFLVVDVGSKVNFDEEMKLKEDYDFSCAHIKAHGSVMRCNRMTLNVKHYANSGGACSNRDSKGEEERRNINILNTKWPGCFRPNPKRRNEVLMSWKGDPAQAERDNVGPSEGISQTCASRAPAAKPGSALKKATRQASAGSAPAAKPGAVVKKAVVKAGKENFGPFNPKAIIVATGKVAKSNYISARARQVSGMTVAKARSVVKFRDPRDGSVRQYRNVDLKYDLNGGYVKLVKVQMGRRLGCVGRAIKC